MVDNKWPSMPAKVIRDGKVAVLISPGFGAGWTTWNSYHPQVELMLYDPEIVNAILDWKEAGGKQGKQFFLSLKKIAKKYSEFEFECFFDGGLRDIHIEWVDVGRKFIIREYDGSESIDFQDEINWYTA